MQTLSVASWTIDSVTNFVGSNTKLELQLHDLDDLLNRIKTQDEKMQSYLSNYNHLERFTLEGFAHWITAQDTMSVQGLLDRIHLLVTGSTDFDNVGNVGVLQLLASRMEVIDENFYYSCGKYHSDKNQLFYIIFPRFKTQRKKHIYRNMAFFRAPAKKQNMNDIFRQYK